MSFRLSSILLIVCVFAIIVQRDTEAKAILDFFFDDTKYQHNNYQHQHRHRAHQYPQPQAPEPVGGKERFKQICNVIRGINDCYA